MNALTRASEWHGASATNEMQSMGLLPKEAWVDDVKARAAELFAGNEHLRTVACLIAASHPRAIDYLEQAPIAARVLADGNPCRSVKQRQYLCRVAGEFALQGSSLNAWLKAKKISPHLRRLRPYALTSSFDLRFFRLISTVNPSTLSQAIPEKGGFQRFWLEAVKGWCGRYRWRNRDLNNLEWAVKNLAPHKDQASEAGNLADYAMEIGTDFDERWTLDVVRRRSREWHDEVAANGMANAKLVQMGLTPAFEVDYLPFPDRHEIGDFTFVALKSALALKEEGAAMHHCVSTYFTDVLMGRSRIYSVLHKGKRTVTAEFDSRTISAVQIKAPYNGRPTEAQLLACSQFCAHVKTLPRPETRP